MEIKYKNGSFGPEDVVKTMALTGAATAAFEAVIERSEIRKAAEEMKASVSDEELQRFSDSLRISMRLHSAEETMSFLKDFGLTVDDFEAFCEAALLKDAVRDRLAPEDKVEEYLLNHRADFTKVRYSVLVVDDENLANEIKMQVEEDEEDFHALARKHSKAESRYAGGYMGVRPRSAFDRQVAVKLFAASAGDVVGPFGKTGDVQLFYVEELMNGQLDDATRAEIKNRIFRLWLEGRMDGGTTVVS